MAFAISRNQVLATVLVAGSFLGLASTSAIYADTQTSTGKASVDVTPGNRTLDNVAGSATAGSLDFGSFSIKDLATSTTPKTAELPAGAFSVTDYSGNKDGWKLMAAVTNFKDAANEKFDGGLTLNGVKLTADDTQKAAALIYSGAQRGTWTSDKAQAEMTVPATANVGHYDADILYTLLDGPVNA
ncbi:hypothetical protein D0504_06630 [Weissella confusa]|uniref:hypothetical protein n=1 Tax=Weissella confusa TaxID=1583 RepID=UPI0021BE1D80|nr:hypothetical protein [Weissella confusa]MCT8393394.1 hypothetical protein [Weissella confusa]